MKILVLGLGNDLLADDGVGLEAARRLRDAMPPDVDVIESPLSGIALLETFIGYDRAVVIDAVKTGSDPVGTLRTWSPKDLDTLLAPSPHYTGLPELLALARALELDYPSEIKIFSMEVEDPCTIGGLFTPAVQNRIGALVDMVQDQVNAWAPSTSTTKEF